MISGSFEMKKLKRFC